MNSQWESNPQVKGLYAVQTFQSRIERDSLVLNAPPRGYSLRCRTWEIEKDSQWDSNPHAKYPQVHHFMGGIEPPEVCAT